MPLFDGGLENRPVDPSEEFAEQHNLGASSGIGCRAADDFADRGARVVVAAGGHSTLWSERSGTGVATPRPGEGNLTLSDRFGYQEEQPR